MKITIEWNDDIGGAQLTEVSKAFIQKSLIENQTVFDVQLADFLDDTNEILGQIRDVTFGEIVLDS